MGKDVAGDVAVIQSIAAIPTILDVVCRTTGMGFAAVARVTSDRWVACEVLDNIHFGLPAGGELDVSTTICAEVRDLKEEVIIDHVDEDPVFAFHHTPRQYGFQSYISVPILVEGGQFFGTLCAIDPHPRQLKNTQVVGMFRLFAQLIAFHIDATRKLSENDADLAASRANLASSEEQLTAVRSDGELREQFIAVLGHDLRNPLSAIASGVRLLATEPADAKTTRVLRHMGESVQRMKGLIDNLMDFARGRLGDGIALDVTPGQRIEPALAQVINETRAANPDRQIEARLHLAHGIDVDQARIAQLLSNLLGNAITHGSDAAPILVEAGIDAGEFVLSVANAGKPIPPHLQAKLFLPFKRGDGKHASQGLGLGLYIAAQIAKAHGGGIDIVSTDAETRFICRLPAGDNAA